MKRSHSCLLVVSACAIGGLGGYLAATVGSSTRANPPRPLSNSAPSAMRRIRI